MSSLMPSLNERLTGILNSKSIEDSEKVNAISRIVDNQSSGQVINALCTLSDWMIDKEKISKPEDFNETCDCKICFEANRIKLIRYYKDILDKQKLRKVDEVEPESEFEPEPADWNEWTIYLRTKPFTMQVGIELEIDTSSGRVRPTNILKPNMYIQPFGVITSTNLSVDGMGQPEIEVEIRTHDGVEIVSNSNGKINISMRHPDDGDMYGYSMRGPSREESTIGIAGLENQTRPYREFRGEISEFVLHDGPLLTEKVRFKESEKEPKKKSKPIEEHKRKIEIE